MLSIYGSRPLKKQTLSNKINRLGVNEKLIVLDGKFDITKLEFEPLSVFSKDNLSKLDEYSDAFIEAVRSRASDTQNIVFYPRMGLYINPSSISTSVWSIKYRPCNWENALYRQKWYNQFI